MPRPSIRRSDEQGETVLYGNTMEHMTARATRTINRTICDTIDDTINLKRRYRTEYHATSRMLMPYIIKTEKLPANLHERRGGKRDDIKSDVYGEGVPLSVSLAVFLHASLAIAPACLTTGWVLSSRFLVSLGLYEWRGGGPFFVPSPRPVFRCSACPTRLPSRPCPAWQHRCPGACGNQLHDRSRGR